MCNFLYKKTSLTYLITVVLISFNFLTNSSGMSSLFNSDTIYLASLFKDVFIEHHSFFAWNLTPAPYFFPDMLVFFSIYAIFNSIFFSMLVYSILQCVCFLFVSSKIAFLVTQKNSAVLLVHQLFLITLTFLSFSMIVPYSTILSPAFHFGSIINGLMLIFCILSYLKKPQKKYLISLFLFSMLGAASDLFFFVWYIFPIMISMFLTTKIRSKNLARYFFKLVACMVIGSIWGVLMKYALVIDVSKNFILNHPDFSYKKIIEFFVVYKKFFIDHSISYTLIPLFYVCLVYKMVKLFKAKKRAINSYQEDGGVYFLIFFVAFSSLCAVVNILIMKNPYNIPMDKPYFRYISPFFWLPIVFVWLPFCSFLNRTFVCKVISNSFYAVLLIIFLKLIYHPLGYQGVYMPKIVSCIDTKIREYNADHDDKIQYGISGYWEAKLTTLFTTENLTVVSYFPDLSRQLIITTPVIYKDRYDFAIVSYKGKKLMLDEALLEKINGKPYSKFYCEPKIAIIIYGKNKLKVQ